MSAEEYPVPPPVVGRGAVFAEHRLKSSRNRGPPEYAAALAEIPLTLPGASPGAAGSDDVSRTADPRTGGCRADQLADRSRTTLKAARVPPDHKASRSTSRPGSRSRRPRTTPQVPSPASAGPDTTLPRAWAGEPPRSRSAVDPGEGLARRTAVSQVLLGVSDVALRVFSLCRGRVILSGVYDAQEAMSPT